MSNLLVQYLINKEKLVKYFSNLFNEATIKKVRRDHHSFRRPRACGLTVHTAIGCPFRCIYCYIYSMGFSKQIKRYPLPPLQLIYSILSNKYFVPGRFGTLIALGSVTEPLHPVVFDYTLELIRLIRRYLDNPIQVSTKMSLEIEGAMKLYVSNPQLSFLMGVTSIDESHRVEPGAPDVKDRFRTLKIMNDLGLHTSLFIRPILPGIIDKEINKILDIALLHGTNKVIFGSLRVNNQILEMLKAVPVLYKNVVKRIGYYKKLPEKKQIVVPEGDIKYRLMKIAKEKGFKVYPSACAANIAANKQACDICGFGPCGDIKSLPSIKPSYIKEFLEMQGISSGVEVHLNNWSIDIYLKKEFPQSTIKNLNIILHYIKTISRRNVKVYRGIS